LKIFSILCFITALLIIFHHYLDHPELKGWRRFIQFKDINNHETAIMFLLGLGIGSMLF